MGDSNSREGWSIKVVDEFTLNTSPQVFKDLILSINREKKELFSNPLLRVDVTFEGEQHAMDWYLDGYLGADDGWCQQFGDIQVWVLEENKIRIQMTCYLPGYSWALGYMKALAGYLRQSYGLGGKNMQVESEIPAAEIRDNKLTKSKRGPRHYSTEEKIKAVEDWDNFDRDAHPITLEEWLEKKFGFNENGDLLVKPSTFYGWRKLKKS